VWQGISHVHLDVSERDTAPPAANPQILLLMIVLSLRSGLVRSTAAMNATVAGGSHRAAERGPPVKS
jgi:hypothetical protein